LPGGSIDRRVVYRDIEGATVSTTLAGTAPVLASPGKALELSDVTDEASFAALAAAWNDAVAGAAMPSVFLRHEWFDAARTWCCTSARLAVIALRREERALAILPLVRPVDRPRELGLLTVPDTQFADLIVADRDATEACRAIAESLRGRSDWDVLRFDYLREDSAVVRHLLPGLRDAGLPVHVAEREGNPFIDIGRSWPDYFATRSRRLKKALNLAANRLSKLGEIRVEHVTSASDEPTLRRALDDAIAISAASWKQRTGNALDQPGPQAFIRALTEAAWQQGWLSLWLLHAGGRPLAMEYQLVHDSSVHALRADFLAECEAISPGTHLFRQLLEGLCDRGWRRYYLGPGYNAYKARWSEGVAPMRRAVVYNRTARGRLERLVEEFAKPALRRARARLLSRDDREAPAERADPDSDASAERSPPRGAPDPSMPRKEASS